jgi:hypothetical protein
MKPTPTVRCFSTILLMLVAMMVSGLITGCASTDPENRAERPWNSPTGWEHGLPTGMMPGGR